MANYLASIFGTEQDKVRKNALDFGDPKLTSFAGQLFLLLQNWRLPPWRPLLSKTRQAVLFTNHPPPEPLPKPGLRSQKQDECLAASKPLRRLLRGLLVRNVQIRRTRRGRRVRQQQRS